MNIDLYREIWTELYNDPEVLSFTTNEHIQFFWAFGEVRKRWRR